MKQFVLTLFLTLIVEEKSLPPMEKALNDLIMKADMIPENEFLQPDVFTSPKNNIDPSKWQDWRRSVWQRPQGLRCDFVCRQVAAVHDDQIGRGREAAHQT